MGCNVVVHFQSHLCPKTSQISAPQRMAIDFFNLHFVLMRHVKDGQKMVYDLVIHPIKGIHEYLNNY